MKSSIKYQGKGTVKLKQQKMFQQVQLQRQEWVKVKLKEVVLQNLVPSSMAFTNVHI